MSQAQQAIPTLPRGARRGGKGLANQVRADGGDLVTAIDRKDRLTRLCDRLFGGAPCPSGQAVSTARIDRSVADHADWRDAETYWAAELPADAERTAGYGRWDENDKETRTQ